MKAYRMTSILICIVAGFTFISSLGWAADYQETRNTLRGLKGVDVVIENIRPEIENDGLTTSQIRNDVELSLRLVGMKVLNGDRWLRGKRKPWLYVNTNVMKTQHSEYIYNIFVSLMQGVILVRNPGLKNTKIPYDAATWSKSFVAVTPYISDIRNDIKNEVDRFLAAWISVNLE